MIRTKEREKRKGDTTPAVKSRNSDSKLSHNSCGGCNACHQMTRIHSATASPTWDGPGDGGQRPCATNFFQRHLGNSYLQSVAGGQSGSGGAPTIQRKCACGGSCASCAGQDEEIRVQPKLTIGPANDVYEQEADRVAEQVMRMPDAAVQSEQGSLTAGVNIRRMPEGGGGDLNASADIQLNRNGGRPLSTSTRRFMEPRFGVDFDHVRLHNDRQAHRTAWQIRARAFACGSHIWLGKGESEQNKKLMAHELAHVQQQKNNTLQRLPFDIELPSGIRPLDATERAMAQTVFGSSLYYPAIFLSDAVGVGGRPFAICVPAPYPMLPPVANIINIGPSAYKNPGSNKRLLIHELTHCWQSQHHPNQTQYIANSLASQAAAAIAGGSAYCYKPNAEIAGVSVGIAAYGAEQVAQQVQNGETDIISEIASTPPLVPHLGNILGLTVPRWETPGDPGVRC